jgi:hypothetical protein
MQAKIKRRLLECRHELTDGAELSVHATERHYRPEDIAELWQLDVSTVRKIFRDVPGVLKHGDERYRTLRIPQSVLDRYHRERAR